LPRYSDDPKKRSAEEKCVADIQHYGLHILKVAGDDDWPEFTYSVGLFHSFEHPEVIVLGLPGDVAHSLVNGLADEVRSGHRFIASEETENVLEGYPCTFRAVPPHHVGAHFGWASWFYDGEPFPALQLVYPDRARRWPWDPDISPGFLAQQPVLATVALPKWAIR
jgi:hypothetical protein